LIPLPGKRGVSPSSEWEKPDPLLRKRRGFALIVGGPPLGVHPAEGAEGRREENPRFKGGCVGRKTSFLTGVFWNRPGPGETLLERKDPLSRPPWSEGEKAGRPTKKRRTVLSKKKKGIMTIAKEKTCLPLPRKKCPSLSVFKKKKSATAKEASGRKRGKGAAFTKTKKAENISPH